jgi:hypothetical protein
VGRVLLFQKDAVYIPKGMFAFGTLCVGKNGAPFPKHKVKDDAAAKKDKDLLAHKQKCDQAIHPDQVFKYTVDELRWMAIKAVDKMTREMGAIPTQANKSPLRFVDNGMQVRESIQVGPFVRDIRYFWTKECKPNRLSSLSPEQKEWLLKQLEPYGWTDPMEDDPTLTPYKKDLANIQAAVELSKRYRHTQKSQEVQFPHSGALTIERLLNAFFARREVDAYLQEHEDLCRLLLSIRDLRDSHQEMVKKAHASLQNVQVPRSSDLDNQKRIQAVLASKWEKETPGTKDTLDYTNCYGTPETFNVYKWLDYLTSDANVRANVRNDAIRKFLENYPLPQRMRDRVDKACNERPDDSDGLLPDKELKGKKLENFKKQRDEFLKTYPKGVPDCQADKKQYYFVSGLCSNQYLSHNVQFPPKRAFLRVLLQGGILDGDRATRVTAALAPYAERDEVGTGAGTSAKVSYPVQCPRV